MHRPLRVANRSLLTSALLMAIGGCLGHRPLIMTPIRVDNALGTGRGAAPVVTRPTETLTDDPMRRIDRLDWPGPNAYRTAAGAPGRDYWQQRADYTVAATLDTTARSIRGTVSIHYTNNSPDTLRFVWIQLDQNLYRPGAKGAAVFGPETRRGARGFRGGYELTGVQVNGRGVAGKVDDTMMRIDLDEPLLPRASASIGMQYSFAIPDHGSDRMGRDSALYQIGQWFPRMAVYDDVRGWNTEPYLGQGEFYLDYGDIDYAVTVPAGFVVAGSGVLDNRRDVLTSTQIERLERAAHASSIVQIITAEEAASAKRRVVPGMRTWRFHAVNVRDVAWAAAPDFRWDATSWENVLAQAFYQFPKAGRGWELAAEQIQWSVRMYSEHWMTYPYPHVTAVAGPVTGTEYPMFVLAPYGGDDPAPTFTSIDHEVGHQWFPMIVGSNERRYAWMDEGLDTYLNAFSTERRTPGRNAFAGYMSSWHDVVENGAQSTLMTAADRVDGGALAAIGRDKPGALLLALRDNVIGRETMDRAMREYVRRWAFKHPSPADFFRTIESVSGADLSWFWNAFFYGTSVLDIAIDGLNLRLGNGQTVAEIHLRRLTSVSFPVTLRLKLNDGSTQDIRLPVDIWARSDRYTALVSVERPVVGARLWPDPNVPDWNRTNDVWGEAPAAERAPVSTSGGLAPPIPAGPTRP